MKLDTNGTAPEHLAELLQDGLVDYTALDVKTSPAKYDLACGGSVDPDLVAASAAVLRQFGGSTSSGQPRSRAWWNWRTLPL